MTRLFSRQKNKDFRADRLSLSKHGAPSNNSRSGLNYLQLGLVSFQLKRYRRYVGRERGLGRHAYELWKIIGRYLFQFRTKADF